MRVRFLHIAIEKENFSIEGQGEIHGDGSFSRSAFS
jgi:hypothetical protein